jgi:SAM-dependent methyltransferase
MKTENHIRNIYKNLSIEDYYQNHDYHNPHFGNIEYLIDEFKNIRTFDNKNVLDLCCGNGEISNLFPKSFVTGCDPYTFEKYKLKTNNECLSKSFLDIINFSVTVMLTDLGLVTFDCVLDHCKSSFKCIASQCNNELVL